MAADSAPDVMLVDITLDGADGIGLMQQLTDRYPHIRLLALTMHQHEETVRQTFLAGAAGFVVKGAASAELLRAIRAVANHQHYVHPVVASTVVFDSLRWLRQADRLSQREIEILRHVTAGRTAAETGEALGISAHTVRRHIANMAAKVGVHGRVGLTRYAVENHLVSPET
jgi:DNA-binding NarL/FixJ family response regulator